MNKKNQYGLYFGTLENDAIISLIKITSKSISIKSNTFPLNTISESLWSNIKEVLSLHQLTKKDIDFCYVNNGPSKFNSDRLITLSAKTFAFFQRVKLFQISNLKLHLLNSKSAGILIDVDSNNSYFAYHDDNNFYYEYFLPNNSLDEYTHLISEAPKKINWMNLEEHQNTVMENLEQFKLIEDSSTLKPNYIREPLKKNQ